MRIRPDLQTFWDWRAAMNFILGGAGGGLILTASLASAYGSPPVLPMLAGAGMIAVGLVCVWFEIGRPERFLNVFRNPKTSWMSREAWVAVALLPLAVAAASNGAPWATLLPAAFALGFVYCQARILCASTGIPVWRRPTTCWLVVATALAEGTALFLILDGAGKSSPTGHAPPVFEVLALSLVTVRALVWRQWAVTLRGACPKASQRSVRQSGPAFLIAGHLLPVLAIAASWMLPTLAATGIPAACVLILAAGWGMKYLLVTRVAHTQGFALEVVPTRCAGAGAPGIRPGWE